jgi:hypothetical protein
VEVIIGGESNPLERGRLTHRRIKAPREVLTEARLR